MPGSDESEIQRGYETDPGGTTGMTTVIVPSAVVTTFFNANVLRKMSLVRSMGGISFCLPTFIGARMTEAHKGQT